MDVLRAGWSFPWRGDTEGEAGMIKSNWAKTWRKSTPGSKCKGPEARRNLADVLEGTCRRNVGDEIRGGGRDIISRT